MYCEKLSWISQLEFLLREFLQRQSQQQMGQEWFRIVQETAGTVGLSAQTSPKKYNLRETLSVLSKLTRDQKLQASAIDHWLGEDWERRLRGLTERFDGLEIRNDLVHGTVFENEDQYWYQWPKVATKVFDAAVVFINLRGMPLPIREEK